METKCISFACPICKAEYEIFLKDIPYLMLMNCPHCKKALSCFEGRVRHANEELIKDIREAKSYSDIKTILIRYDKKKKNNNNKIELIDHVISKDDIIDLKIDLNNAKTFDDVMKVIDGDAKK